MAYENLKKTKTGTTVIITYKEWEINSFKV